jgi:CelD/BcsL family acetyltransferase involved in cellulose biosynthesis
VDAVTTSVRVVRLDGFEDPRLTRQAWDALVMAGATRSVFLTHWWQSAWWQVFGRGELVLLAAEVDGSIRAVLPLFCDGGMLFLVASGGSDALDVIGDASGPGVLEALLTAAWNAVPDAVGVRLYLVPDESSTGGRLRDAALVLGLACFDEDELVAPSLDLRIEGAADAAIGKQSLRRHEAWFARNGDLVVEHHRDGPDVAPHLDALFEQHIARWADTPFPSLFLDDDQRAFYRRLVSTAPRGGPLRFTRVLWDERPIALHFGTSYAGRYLWYKPSFETDLASRSPGEVLLRSLLRAAVDEGAETFDFGLGDEAFKDRFATDRPLMRTWGCYPEPVER